MNRRILVIVPPHPDSAPAISEAFRRSAPFLDVDLASAADIPVGALRERRYEGVVCWGNRPEHLGVVTWIRGCGPTTPIFLISSGTDEEFRELALNAGASFLLPDSNSLTKLVSQIEQAVESAAGAVEIIHGPRKADPAPRRRPTERGGRLSPLPLLVSDLSPEAAKLEEAFARAGMFAPLPILRGSEEAIAYLSGKPPFANRERHPLPSLILLDFHGPRGAGLDLLGWIRQQSPLRHLPVIVLSAALDVEDIKGAYGLQANSYLIKPGNFDELVEMVKAIKLYWSSLNISPET